MLHQGRQDLRKETQHLIAEAQAARVQEHVRAMLSQLTARRTKFPKTT